MCINSMPSPDSEYVGYEANQNRTIENALILT